MRVALHSEILPGAVEEYRSRHQRVPEELAALFERAGIHDWTIFRSGQRLFHLVDCDDWGRAMAVVRSDPADARWQADIGRLVATFLDADGSEGYAPPRRGLVLAGAARVTGVYDTHVHIWDAARFDYKWLAEVPELDQSYPISSIDRADGQVTRMLRSGSRRRRSRGRSAACERRRPDRRPP